MQRTQTDHPSEARCDDLQWCVVEGCSQAVSAGYRRYCVAHSRDASRRIKRADRAAAKLRGEPYWLEPYLGQTLTIEEARREYNAYMAAYMRKYRARRRRQRIGGDETLREALGTRLRSIGAPRPNAAKCIEMRRKEAAIAKGK